MLRNGHERECSSSLTFWSAGSRVLTLCTGHSLPASEGAWGRGLGSTGLPLSPLAWDCRAPPPCLSSQFQTQFPALVQVLQPGQVRGPLAQGAPTLVPSVPPGDQHLLAPTSASLQVLFPAQGALSTPSQPPPAPHRPHTATLTAAPPPSLRGPTPAPWSALPEVCTSHCLLSPGKGNVTPEGGLFSHCCGSAGPRVCIQCRAEGRPLQRIHESSRPLASVRHQVPRTRAPHLKWCGTGVQPTHTLPQTLGPL